MSNKTDSAAIYRHRDKYNSALKQGNLNAYLATLTDDCVFHVPGMPALKGKEAIRSWIAATYFEPFNLELDYDFEELEFAGDWAFGWGWFKQTLSPKGGGEVLEPRGKFLDIFRRDADGEWRLAHVAFSADNGSNRMKLYTGAIDRTADEAAIRSLLGANREASSARNAKEVAATYLPDGDAWIAGLSRWTTRDSIIKAEEDFCGMPGFQSYDGTIETIRFISPDAAIVEITGTTTLDTGSFQEETTIVVARTENGWKIAAWRVMTFDETLLNLLRK